MTPNRMFFPQAALDAWLGEGKADLTGDDLHVREDGRMYRIVEGVRILREVTGAPDTNELEGRVKTVAYLVELGAELMQGSLLLGEHAYDVVPGFLGTLRGESRDAPAPPSGRAPPISVRPAIALAEPVLVPERRTLEPPAPVLADAPASPAKSDAPPAPRPSAAPRAATSDEDLLAAFLLEKP